MTKWRVLCVSALGLFAGVSATFVFADEETNPCVLGRRTCSGLPVTCTVGGTVCNKCELDFDEREPGLTGNYKWVLPERNCGSQFLGFVSQGQCNPPQICGIVINRCGARAIVECD